MYLGYDNYNHKLPEPTIRKTLKLVDEISDLAFVVRKTIRPAWFESLEGHIGGK